jgi:thiamine biosynthesis protein ThiS
VSTATSPIEIRLNGEPYLAPAGGTVADLVRHLGIPEDRVAVELNRRIVRRPEWAATPVEAGAAVEVVQLVGGG